MRWNICVNIHKFMIICIYLYFNLHTRFTRFHSKIYENMYACGDVWWCGGMVVVAIIQNTTIKISNKNIIVYSLLSVYLYLI